MEAPSASVVLPAEHGAQAAALVAPTAAENEPREQAVQALPLAPEYVPAPHASQAAEPGCGAMAPGAHAAQVAAVVAPRADDAVPAGQKMQPELAAPAAGP